MAQRAEHWIHFWPARGLIQLYVEGSEIVRSTCIFSQFSEFRIQNMHSTLYVYFQAIFRNILPHILMHVSENRLKIHI